MTREYYINDAGNQVENLSKSIEARYLQELGQDAEMPEDGYHGEDIKGFAKELVAEKGDSLLSMDPGERAAYFRKYGLEKELNKIKRDLNRFRVHFDEWFSETSLYEKGLVEESLNELKAKGQVYEQDGATWLRTTDYGDDKDRVLVKNDGTYTYLTPDIAYHRNKFERGYDRLINIWGADHHGYIPRMKAAMEAIGYDPERLTVLIAQMVSLFQNGEKVKMSKRTGKAVTMEDLMEEVGVDASVTSSRCAAWTPIWILTWIWRFRRPMKIRCFTCNTPMPGSAASTVRQRSRGLRCCRLPKWISAC
ncbi:Arginine--tRNA ligase [Paenibacillus sp. P1XP2]|nr:Arginine--tRNA ligase [Paenibacillus sp. P1XP2]